MRPEVVRALATGREHELADVMAAIRQAITQPDVSPQHTVIYGERGSGKSFLLRLVQLELEVLVEAEDVAAAFVLLPEELYNIRSEAQLIEAIAVSVRGQGESFSYAVDTREPQVAWNNALENLANALDTRFGIGKGLLIAAVENFDDLAKKLFGANTAAKSKSQRAIEQRRAEERFRKLLNTKEARFLLLASATGTVDMDYDRPLFQAFKAIDLTPWANDTCIEYFNRRRELANASALTHAETARARAIAEFIGGNPRLAQLLGDVLASPDARTVADTLDALSDHLADYYRRRLDDLPSNAAGLLDALIRKGEPCSQSELAERVNLRQNQIADAFSYLTEARLLTGVQEIGGPRTLYRVRDRLFVYFYRRRYGDSENASILVRISELLETFFTAEEKKERALRHLELGELNEARLYIDLRRKELTFCPYRDQYKLNNESFWISSLAGTAYKDIATDIPLSDHPLKAFEYWRSVSASSTDPLKQAAASALQALAASNCDLDNKANEVLHKSLDVAKKSNNPDAQILLVQQMVLFNASRLNKRKKAITLAKQISDLIDNTQNNTIKLQGLLAQLWVYGHQNQYDQSIIAANKALKIAKALKSDEGYAEALIHKGYALIRKKLYDQSIDVLDEAETLFEQIEDVFGQAESLLFKAWSLYFKGEYNTAIIALNLAENLAKKIKSIILQIDCLCCRSRILSSIAAQSPTSNVIDQFTMALSVPGEKDHWLDDHLDDLMAAVAWVGVWPQLHKIIKEHAFWFEKHKAAMIFNKVGKVWAAKVREDGRAKTFATVTQHLSDIIKIMMLIPSSRNSDSISFHMHHLVEGLAAYCDDAGFLEDIADLVIELVPSITNATEQLRVFAAFHAAKDKEAFLQRLNPDLATAIRCMWDVPSSQKRATINQRSGK